MKQNVQLHEPCKKIVKNVAANVKNWVTEIFVKMFDYI